MMNCKLEMPELNLLFFLVNWPDRKSIASIYCLIYNIYYYTREHPASACLGWVKVNLLINLLINLTSYLVTYLRMQLKNS